MAKGVQMKLSETPFAVVFFSQKFCKLQRKFLQMVIFTPPPPLKKWILCQATMFHIGAMKRSRKVANSNPSVKLDGGFSKV